MGDFVFWWKMYIFVDEFFTESDCMRFGPLDRCFEFVATFRVHSTLQKLLYLSNLFKLNHLIEL